MRHCCGRLRTCSSALKAPGAVQRPSHPRRRPAPPRYHADLMPPQLAHHLPFLRWPRPTAALLRNEAMAGLTVGLMVIPQGVAYAQLAGMPLITGIYASLLPALAAVLFSASARLSETVSSALASPGRSPRWASTIFSMKSCRRCRSVATASRPLR